MAAKFRVVIKTAARHYGYAYLFDHKLRKLYDKDGASMVLAEVIASTLANEDNPLIRCGILERVEYVFGDLYFECGSTSGARQALRIAAQLAERDVDVNVRVSAKRLLRHVVR